MGIKGLSYLLGWECLLLFGRYDYVEMTRFSMIKILLSCRSSTGAQLCLFMIIPTTCRELRPVYGGVYMVKRTTRDIFIQHGCNVIYVLVLDRHRLL
jgi:hypothetical protein